MEFLDTFLATRVDQLTAGRPVPVDLMAICSAVGAIVEEREMIPEAAIDVDGKQFLIYLQSNFANMPGFAVRRRFSLAHEIGHTLFYEERDGELKPGKDAPRGIKLEAACHKAASMILVPSAALKASLRDHPPDDATTIYQLASHFDVSAEVMVRRLNELGSFENTWAPVLTRRVHNHLEIVYAVYPTWLKSQLPPPERGTPFNRWLSGTEQADGSVTKVTHRGTLTAIPVSLSGNSVMFEMRICP